MASKTKLIINHISSSDGPLLLLSQSMDGLGDGNSPYGIGYPDPVSDLHDTNLWISGSSGGKGIAGDRGVTVFGGDAIVSGNLYSRVLTPATYYTGYTTGAIYLDKQTPPMDCGLFTWSNPGFFSFPSANAEISVHLPKIENVGLGSKIRISNVSVEGGPGTYAKLHVHTQGDGVSCRNGLVQVGPGSSVFMIITTPSYISGDPIHITTLFPGQYFEAVSGRGPIQSGMSIGVAPIWQVTSSGSAGQVII